jgi:DNA polymerase III subunit chi
LNIVTRVDFHFNLPDKLAYCCRLLRKVHKAGKLVVVFDSQVERLKALDRALWTFSPNDFIPHVMTGDPLASDTPILLTSNELTPTHHRQILVNLDEQWPPFFSQFERLIELVSAEDADRQLGRGRFKFYRDRGYAIESYDRATQ